MCYHNFRRLLNTHKLRNRLLACTQTNCLYLAMFAEKTTFDYSSSSSLFLSLGLNHKQWEAGQLKQEQNKQANKQTNNWWCITGGDSACDSVVISGAAKPITLASVLQTHPGAGLKKKGKYRKKIVADLHFCCSTKYDFSGRDLKFWTTFPYHFHIR